MNDQPLLRLELPGVKTTVRMLPFRFEVASILVTEDSTLLEARGCGHMAVVVGLQARVVDVNTGKETLVSFRDSNLIPHAFGAHADRGVAHAIIKALMNALTHEVHEVVR